MPDANPFRAAMISIRDVSKSYGAFEALNQVSMHVARGEKIVICGPSGSGKSTLIRCVNGMEHHDTGVILVDGMEMTSDRRRAKAVRRKVGMIFQSFNLFPHLTILQNCMLAPVKSLGMHPRIAREIAMEHLQKVRVADQRDKYPPTLSGGQQQRAAIARALCMRPEVLLLDEPTSALDPETVNEVLDTMMTLARDGMTMICVTHEMGFARRIADRIIFMEAGRIVEVAEPGRFFTSAQTSRARSFLGHFASS